MLEGAKWWILDMGRMGWLWKVDFEKWRDFEDLAFETQVRWEGEGVECAEVGCVWQGTYQQVMSHLWKHNKNINKYVHRV